MTFQEKLDNIITKNNSLLCVGLDPVLEKLPVHLGSDPTIFFTFNKAIIDATADLVCAFKPNSAFYEAHGVEGIQQLKMTCDYLHEKYPEIVIVLDAKRGDIGSTNNGYVTYAFDWLGADMITLHPYFGSESLQPFFARTDKGSIILTRSSNPGGGELQDILVKSGDDGSNEQIPLYQHVAKQVVEKWNTHGNVLIMCGATFPEELAEVRKIAGDMTFLVPGVGAQRGGLQKILKDGLNSQKKGMIISASREVIYAGNSEDFAEKARAEAQKLRDEINKYRL